MEDRSHDTILDQIAKLMAMADPEKNSNANEAAVAAAKATRLMRRHNLSEAQVRAATSKAKAQYVKKFVGRMDSRWNATLAANLAKHNFCDVVLTHGKDPTRPDIQVIGQADNVEVVEYLYTYLLREIRRLARVNFLREQPTITEGKYNRAFGVGAVSAIALRLLLEQAAEEKEEEAAGQTDAIRALIVVKDHDLKEAVNNFFGPLKPATKAPNVEADAFNTGYSEGQNLQMRKGINEKAEK